MKPLFRFWGMEWLSDYKHCKSNKGKKAIQKRYKKKTRQKLKTALTETKESK